MTQPVKHLTLLSPVFTGIDYEQAKKLEREDKIPRKTPYQEVVKSDLFDSSWFSTIPAERRFLYRPFPRKLVQVLEAYAIRRRFRVIISWSEFAATVYAMLLKITRSRSPHVALMYWMSLPKVARLLKYSHSHIDRIITWSSVQRAYAINTLGVPPQKISLIRHFVDEEFWRPESVETEMICSAGREMRDFPTLIEAVRGLAIPCHIATGDLRGTREPSMTAIAAIENLPQNVTVGKMSPTDLRALYARSRFVVIPLLPSDTDNGVSVILEAMAMGKTVICSRTAGQVDVIQEGETGIFVPPGDVRALREAIQALWDQPEKAATMGKAARAYVERFHSLRQFVNSIAEVVEEVAVARGV